MPRPGTNHFHAQHSVYLFHGDFTQIAKITRKRLLQTQANLARRLEKEYAQVEEELRLREKIEALKERAKMVLISFDFQLRTYTQTWAESYLPNNFCLYVLFELVLLFT